MQKQPTSPPTNTPNKFVSCRDFRGRADTAAGKPLTVSQMIWTQLRSPFLLPTNCCVKCVDWETIEYGKMGCRVCGAFHVCCTSTCPLAEIENNTVCTITGVVVKTITYDKDEYLTTATCDDSNKTSNTYALSQPNDSATVENSSKYTDQCELESRFLECITKNGVCRTASTSTNVCAWKSCVQKLQQIVTKKKGTSCATVCVGLSCDMYVHSK
jgi:hypothetical protein